MNKFKFKYLETSAGWIWFKISYGKYKESNYEFSYAFESPADLVEWAKRIQKGENLTFECDAEGWCWFFEYDGKNVIISDDHYDEKNNPGNEKQQRIKFEYDRTEFCTEILSSFQKFMTDGTYKPIEWEGFDVIDILSGKEIHERKEFDEALKALAELSFSEIKSRLALHPYSKILLKKANVCNSRVNYEKLSPEKRMGWLEHFYYDCDNSGCSLLGYFNGQFRN